MSEDSVTNSMEESDNIPAIIIGSSAGGVEALSELLAHIPEDTGVAFVVVQHLPAEHKSNLARILSRRCKVPVQEMKCAGKLKANTVAVMPAAFDLVMEEVGHVALRERTDADVIHLPIDMLLISSAPLLRNRLGAIILTGTGSDGTRGARVVKESGGVVAVQDPKTATFSQMPASVINARVADLVAELPELIEFVVEQLRPKTDVEAADALNEDLFMRLMFRLRSVYKLDFSAYKQNGIQRRLRRRMQMARCPDLTRYVELATSNDDELDNLFHELLVGVTSFRRDKHVFDALEQDHFLNILKSAPANSEIRIWAAGCSTGEEAYSLAITFKELVDREKLPLTLKIFATDIDADAIATAGNGIYNASVVADLPPEIIARYFEPEGDAFVINRHIRKMIVFARHDLISDPPFTRMDLICCRNVLIYIGGQAQQSIIRTFHFALKPNGLLVLGAAESLGNMSALFDVVSAPDKIYAPLFSRALATGESKNAGEENDVGAPRRAGSAAHWRWPADSTLMQTSHERKTAQEVKFLDAVLRELAEHTNLFAVAVNSAGEIERIIGESSLFLTPPNGKMTSDIRKLILPGLQLHINGAFRDVLRNGNPINMRGLTAKTVLDREIRVDVDVIPFRSDRNGERLVLMTFRPPDARHEFVSAVSELSADDAQNSSRNDELEQELMFTRERLQATIEELETSNEELQATNEELLASNEELQSTNEELQSVNEELHTINAEFQEKINEAAVLGEDLENLMSLSDSVFIFLDHNLQLRRFSRNVSRVFNIIKTDIGRPLSMVLHQIDGVELIDLVENVLVNGEKLSITVMIKNTGEYLLDIVPYSYISGKQNGAVLLLSPLDPRAAREQKD